MLPLSLRRARRQEGLSFHLSHDITAEAEVAALVAVERLKNPCPTGAELQRLRVELPDESPLRRRPFDLVAVRVRTCPKAAHGAEEKVGSEGDLRLVRESRHRSQDF